MGKPDEGLPDEVRYDLTSVLDNHSPSDKGQAPVD